MVTRLVLVHDGVPEALREPDVADRERQVVRAGHCGEHRLERLGAGDGQLVLAAEQRERGEQTREAVEVVAVEVRDADRVEAPAAEPGALHLELRALAAVEQDRAAVAADGRAREVTGFRREGGARPERDDVEHGAEAWRASGYSAPRRAVRRKPLSPLRSLHLSAAKRGQFGIVSSRRSEAGAGLRAARCATLSPLRGGQKSEPGAKRPDGFQGVSCYTSTT